MATGLRILYRGPLASCNYGCEYCPFAKRHDTAAQLRDDRQRLERFSAWVERNSDRELGVLFTPWGEALTRAWYRDAMTRLSWMPHVTRVAAQTNLSYALDWLADVDREALALWCTYHPGESTRVAFLQQCERLLKLGVRFSVGVVGLAEHATEIEALRAELPGNVYLWINAYKRVEDYYESSLFEQFRRIDPLFSVNAVRHESFGRACHTGESVITVDGCGDIRRCHFVDERIGNIYEDGWDRCLRPRPCPNSHCGCHIGYVHMPSLELEPVFGANVLERIPVEAVHAKPQRPEEIVP